MTENQSQPTPRIIENQLQPKLKAIELFQFPFLATKYGEFWSQAKQVNHLSSLRSNMENFGLKLDKFTI